MDIIKQNTATEQMDHRVRIGKRIAEMRKALGISQAKLAQLTGIDSGYIGRIELGKIPAGIENLSKIGDVLGMQLDFVPKNKG